MKKIRFNQRKSASKKNGDADYYELSNRLKNLFSVHKSRWKLFCLSRDAVFQINSPYNIPAGKHKTGLQK
jgi:hypothetical protein